ncbi:MAG TPA: SH3 domain-containing protein [Anaerolineales bacterium]|nr:SH3 domain-containing protein [Anaerolineales bacterium]
MNPDVLEILRSVFFWIMLLGVIGGYASLRIANRNRDRAAFIEYPDNPEKFLLRARIAYAMFVVFLLVMIAGLGIVVFQILQVYRPAFNLPVLEPSPFAPTATASPEATATPTAFIRTATPTPTRTPTPLLTATPEIGFQARIGNTSFQGVNVRAGPGIENEIVAKLSPGTPVLVYDEAVIEADGFGWRHVQLEDGIEGWIAEDFLVPVENPDIP